MRLLKRLDSFVLKSFLPLFAMTFFIVLFIVLMQFLWKYIDDLVGKGFSLDLLAELFFYAAVCMIPMALPLAILLASLMTFGNFGEKFELTAMKASGISLVRVMAPLIVFIGAVAVGAFFFQNDVLPKAQVKMWTLLFSMKQKSPELEIPEGVFYDQIPGYNLFVKHKNTDTGMLYDVMIYDVSKGAENGSIVLADSSRLAFTKDLRYLYLHLFGGEQFENLRDQQTGDRNVPFRREEFKEKEILIPFDANFNRLDEEGMRKQYVGKNIKELRTSIDSLQLRVDSMGKIFTRDLKREAFPLLVNLSQYTDVEQTYNTYTPGVVNESTQGLGGVAAMEMMVREQEIRDSVRESQAERMADSIDRSQFERRQMAMHGGIKEKSTKNVDYDKMISLAGQEEKGKKVVPVSIDSLLLALEPGERSQVFDAALNITRRHMMETEFKSVTMADEKKTMRRHDIEMLKKFTLSVACLIMFFIGAPLGAIIRKGGIGTPLVISVLLFLVYYIIDNTGYKMARDGRWPVWFGMWLSTVILVPLGIYVTIKAMNDSAVFDRDRIMAFVRKVMGRKPERIVKYKEVIIEDISREHVLELLRGLCLASEEVAESISRKEGYVDYFLYGYDTNLVRRYSEQLEADIDELTNYPDTLVTNRLPDMPVVMPVWAMHPAHKKWLGMIFIILFPIGVPIWFAGRRTMRNLRKDLHKVEEVANSMIGLVESE